MAASFALLCLAALFLLLAALPLPISSPVNLGWLGMFLWALSLLVQ